MPYGKLKHVITRYSILEEFLDHFFAVLTTLCTGVDHKALVMIQKRKVTHWSDDSSESGYSKLLTPYAAPFVIMQLQLARHVEVNVIDGVYCSKSAKGLETFSLHKCTCIFQSVMRLPCQHILALRLKLNKPLLDPTACNEKWTQKYSRTRQFA